ncbi:hypothetical protein FRB90_003648 [Tulasnella sp. 427]|nr:hypothetical protein FRB90_003648 [Tulasnella sp. 427]
MKFPNSCKVKDKLAASAPVPNMFLISTIFMMRTYALYERSRLTLAVLVVTYILCFAPALAHYYIAMEHGLSAEAWAAITDVAIVKKFLSVNRVDMTQGWWPLTTCTSIAVPPELGAIMLSALVYESGLMFAMVYKLYGQRQSRLINRLYLDGLAYYLLMFGTLVAAAFVCYYNTMSRAWMASRFVVGMKSVLCSRMILRLRWYSSSGEAQSPTFGGQEEALATGTDIFFAEADKTATGEWTKNEDFGIEVPVGSVLSHGAGVESYAAIAMVPVENRGIRSGEGIDWESGYSLCEECMESQGGEEEATLKSTPSVSFRVDRRPASRGDLSTRNEGSEPGPSRQRDETSSLPPEG